MSVLSTILYLCLCVFVFVSLSLSYDEEEEDEDPFEIARVDCNGCSQHNRPLEAVPQMINLSQGSLHGIHRITISDSQIIIHIIEDVCPSTLRFLEYHRIGPRVLVPLALSFSGW